MKNRIEKTFPIHIRVLDWSQNSQLRNIPTKFTGKFVRCNIDDMVQLTLEILDNQSVLQTFNGAAYTFTKAFYRLCSNLISSECIVSSDDLIYNLFSEVANYLIFELDENIVFRLPKTDSTYLDVVLVEEAIKGNVKKIVIKDFSESYGADCSLINYTYSLAKGNIVYPDKKSLARFIRQNFLTFEKLENPLITQDKYDVLLAKQFKDELHSEASLLTPLDSIVIPYALDFNLLLSRHNDFDIIKCMSAPFNFYEIVSGEYDETH